jgi:hypothetical protein
MGEDGVVHNEHGGVLCELNRHGSSWPVHGVPDPSKQVPVLEVLFREAGEHGRLYKSSRSDIPVSREREGLEKAVERGQRMRPAGKLPRKQGPDAPSFLKLIMLRALPQPPLLPP